MNLKPVAGAIRLRLGCSCSSYRRPNPPPQLAPDPELLRQRDHRLSLRSCYRPSLCLSQVHLCIHPMVPITVRAPLLQRIRPLHRTKRRQLVTFAALVLPQRLKARFPMACGSSGHMLLISTFSLSPCKVTCDNAYSNKSYSDKDSTTFGGSDAG